MTKPLLSNEMKSKISETFEFSESKDNPGKIAVYNKKLGRSMVWAFDNTDMATGFIIGLLLEDDSEEASQIEQIDPQINIVHDFEGDFVINIKGPVSFGTYGSHEDALPLAAQLSKLIVGENYYSDPSDPTVG
jgi:hypothetical protein